MAVAASFCYYDYLSTIYLIFDFIKMADHVHTREYFSKSLGVMRQNMSNWEMVMRQNLLKLEGVMRQNLSKWEGVMTQNGKE